MGFNIFSQNKLKNFGEKMMGTKNTNDDQDENQITESKESFNFEIQKCYDVFLSLK